MNLTEAISILQRSPRGKHALRGLETFLSEHATSLDEDGADAVVELTRLFVGDYPAPTLEAIQTALEP